MKRSFINTEEESSLTLEEWRERSSYYNQKYREKLSLLFTTFLSHDGDIVFKTFIIKSLSRDLGFGELVSLRLVSKEWDEWVTSVTHLNLNKKMTCYRSLLEYYFKNVRSLRSNKAILTSVGHEIACGRISKLCITGWDDEVDVVSMEPWISLTKLTLAPNIIPEKMYHLTSLRELRCDVSTMFNQPLIYTLTNLTSLSITGFDRGILVAKHLTRLVYLESDYPTHFTSFSGSGLLSAVCNSRLNNMLPDAEEEADFDAYYKGCSSIKVSGSWSNGSPVGKGYSEIICHDTQGYKVYIRGGIMDGKLEGIAKETNFDHFIMYIGEWKNGAKHGDGVMYSLFQSKLQRTLTQHIKPLPIHKERWVDGCRVECIYSTTDTT
jgi:hypothetical protein